MLQDSSENATPRRSPNLVVCGFYTPDYADIAANLARSLDAHTIAHKIYPVQKFGETWIAQPLRKPEIILRCMEEFPGRVIVFMDADCMVHDDIAPLAEGIADVGLHLFKTPRGPKRGQVFPSSRVVVCRPTETTKAFLRIWRAKCEATMQSLAQVRGSQRKLWSRGLTEDNDEKLLLDAIAETTYLTVHILPAHYTGNGNEGASLVSHVSARDKFAPPPKGPSVLKRVRRRLVEIAVGKPYEEWKKK